MILHTHLRVLNNHWLRWSRGARGGAAAQHARHARPAGAQVVVHLRGPGRAAHSWLYSPALLPAGAWQGQAPAYLGLT